MDKIIVEEEKGLLDELVAPRPVKARLYHAVTISSTLFIFFVIVDFFVDLKRLTFKNPHWSLVLIILPLPVIALFFHLKSKRAGWFIGYFYYICILMLGGYSVANQFMEAEPYTRKAPALRVTTLLILSLTVTIFLLTKPVRDYFAVKKLGLTVSTIIFIITGVVFFIFFA